MDQQNLESRFHNIAAAVNFRNQSTMASLVRLRLALGRTLRPNMTTSLQPYTLVTTTLSVRPFSTPPATENVHTNELQDEEIQEKVTQSLCSVNIPADATTAGKVLHYLTTQCKDELTNAHIQALVKTCESPTDYPKLLHAITTFQQTRGYIMDTETADSIIHVVLKASPDSPQGALWVLENFKKRTGLYYSATAYAVNRALDSLLVNVESVKDPERVWKALQKVSTKLIQRKTIRGARGLSKRAKRTYLKHLQNKGGPTQHTVRRVVEISTKLKGVDETTTAFIEPFQAAHVSIHPMTLEWLEAQKEGNTVEESESAEAEEGEASASVEEEEAASSEQADESKQEESSEEDDKKE